MSQALTTDEYITVKDVARIMHCSVPTIYRWVAARQFLKPTKFGHSSRWSRNEVYRFLRRKSSDENLRAPVEGTSLPVETVSSVANRKPRRKLPKHRKRKG